MKIAVAGTGYVGLSNALLLSQHNDVWAVDILQSKIDLINKGKSPIVDREIEEFLAREDLHLTATTDAEKAYKEKLFRHIFDRNGDRTDTEGESGYRDGD